MFYCKNCKLLSETGECTSCGEYCLKPVEDKDLILLTKRDYITAGMLEDILTKNQIPYIKKGRLGAYFAVLGAHHLEEYSFFVTYNYYQQALELVEECFSS